MCQTQIENLPFIARQSGNVINYWSPGRTGNYGQDCETGRGYADSLLQFLRDSGRVQVLPWIARALPGREEFGGVEIGFMTRIAGALLEAPHADA